MPTTVSRQELICRWLNSGHDETLAKRRFDEYSRAVTADLLKSLNRFNYSEPEINRDMLHEALIKMLTLVRDRPQAAACVKAFVFGLSQPKRSEPFAEQLADWKTAVPVWADRAMGFCQRPPAEICEQQAKSINDELPSLLAKGETLLDWIGWQSEAASHDVGKERSKLIWRRVEALGKLAEREGKAAVDAELKQPNGADFVFDTHEICKLAPSIKIPTTGLLYTIAANKIRDYVEKVRREISCDTGWDDENEPSGSDILTTQPSPEPPRPNLQRADCMALLREPLRQAEAKLAEASAKLDRFREENRQPRQIKQAEQDHQEAQDTVDEEKKRLHDNLQVLEWRLKVNPEDNQPYSDTFIAEQIDFADYERRYDDKDDPDGKKESERRRQKVRDCKADIGGLLLPLHPNPKQYLAKKHAQLGDFLLDAAESHDAAISCDVSAPDGEDYKTLSQDIDKLLKAAEKQIEAALKQAEHKRWQVEDRLANLCLHKIHDPADKKAQRQDLLELLARAELGEREIARRWKVDLEAVKSSARQWREAQASIRQAEEALTRQRRRRGALQSKAQAVVYLLIGPTKPKEIARMLGLEVEQIYPVRQQIRDALNLQNTQERL